MKQLYKSALLAVLGLASVTVARANTDLFIGFNDNNITPASSQNDYVIDIGSFASLQADALADGGTVNLMNVNAGLNQINGSTFATTFNTAFGADPKENVDVSAGVVGGQTGANPKQLWQTAPVGVTPGAINGNGVSAAANDAQTLVAGEYASSTTTGFSYLIAASSTQPGTDASGTLTGSSHTNPMGLLGIGVYPSLVLNLWENTRANGTTTLAGGWKDEGYFTFDIQDDILTYTVPVPEPAVYGSVAGAGLLLLALRRQFTARNA